MKRNFDTLKVGRWYLNRARTCLVKIVSLDKHEVSPFKGGDNNGYRSKGGYFEYDDSDNDLIYEFPAAWEQMGVGSLMEESKKPEYDRDEVLRVATALATGDYANSMGGATPYSELVSDAIELIDAVNECIKGGNNAIR